MLTRVNAPIGVQAVPPALVASLEPLRLAPDGWPPEKALVVDHRSYPGAQVWVHQDGVNRTLVPHAVLERVQDDLVRVPVDGAVALHILDFEDAL